MKTLEETRDDVMQSMEKGYICPCCGQFAKMYSRSITSAMAYGMILFYQEMYKHTVSEYLHIESFFKVKDIPSSIRGDFPKLRYWGLITESGEGNGYYALTNEGRGFVRGYHKVQSHIRLYNNKFYGFKGDQVSIKDCLKNKFSYEKLMNNTL